MDRQSHDYAPPPPPPPMSFAPQLQQAGNVQPQYGFHHQQHQQFPHMVGHPFLLPHPSLQQQPFHHQPQVHPVPPHLLHPHPQQPVPPSFFPQVPHLTASSYFMGAYESGPPTVPPPSDPELHKRVDKLVEYAAKNGPEFEAMIREKQQENPAYGFMFGGEGHAYYRYKLWSSTRPSAPFNPSMPPLSMPMMHHHHPNPMINPSMPAPPPPPPPPPPFNAVGVGIHPNLPYYDSYSQTFGSHPEFSGTSTRHFKGLSGPLPSDVVVELNDVLNNLTGTKESIKGAKLWFMQRSPFAPALAEALRDRFCTLDDSERQLHIIYLANDILFDSLQRRPNPHDLDNEALAFKPILGLMLARVYHSHQNKQENQSRLQKILQFWASKEVYDYDTIRMLESEMLASPPPPPLSDESHGVPPLPSVPRPTEKEVQEKKPSPDAVPTCQQVTGTIAAAAAAALPLPPPPPPLPTTPPPVQVPPSCRGGDGSLPPYPLFPPGLIPGMVRKMQIGSGVPYSPMSPLDIPMMIPPSTISDSEVVERVTKFFKEIGEADPSPALPRRDDYEEHERDPPARKGGACIPPPASLHAVEPDSFVETALVGSMRSDDATQYDDVYSSYRKHRSTSYHSSLSSRAR